MEVKNEAKLSVLMFPWIGHSHVFPYLELSKGLSNKNFHVFFCSTAIILDSVKNSLQEQSNSIKLVELQLPSFPDLPPEMHTTKNIPRSLLPRLFQAFRMSVSSFTDIITDLKPDLVIYDVFQPWAAKIASSMNIPAVHFITIGGAAISFSYHDFTVRDSVFPYPAIYLTDNERKAMQAVFGEIKRDEGEKGLAFQLSYEIVLMKTCRGVEGKYVDYLSVLCKKNVVPVGPLITKSNNEQNGSEIVEWLNKKPQFSTVLISFGSETSLSNDQMEEIAEGLELCDVNFIWVVRSPVGETVNLNDVMPKGFLDRVEGRGMIVQGWVPQTKILAHKSIGAFVNHCGMSSMIESFYFGVPVIAVPFQLDQPLNARLSVEIGVGIEVTTDDGGNLRRDDLANAINKVMVEASGEKFRLRAVELSETMKNEEEDDMNEVAEQLLQVCIKYKQQT